MKAFVQCEGGRFANISHFTAYLGFREFGYEIQLFAWNDLESLALTRETIVAGGIPAVVRALSRLGIEVPTLPAIPDSIASFAGRKTWASTLSEVRSHFTGEVVAPLFFKPIPADRKLFNGTVAKVFRDLIATAGHRADLPVLCSELVHFVSEYRVFVLQREIIGCKHYKGDFRISPDFAVIDAAVAAFDGSPSAYGIDFGVTAEGKTLLVEVNDAYSLGCYGLGETRYARMLEVRWRELTSQPLE
jgi:ATP-grasp domain, R2K clade family 2